MEKIDTSKLLDNWFDYSFLLEAMEQWLLTHAHKVNTEGHLLNGHKYARRAKTMAALLRRVLEDDYLDNAKKRDGIVVDFWFEKLGGGCSRMHMNVSNREKYDQALKHANAMRKQDLEMFGKYFAKYILQLWD